MTTKPALTTYCGVVQNCVPPTCDDGIQNQDETGIDCGGPCTGCSNILK